MSFSPRARPHTVNLSFTDQDLTDTYRDETQSLNNNSNLSSPRHRHARGDTPLSTTKSRGQSSRTGSTSSWNGSQRNGNQSNLDKLLDFLDQEEAGGNAYETRRMERSIATSTPPPIAAQNPQPDQQYSSNRSSHRLEPSFYRSQSPSYSNTPSALPRSTRDQSVVNSVLSHPNKPRSTVSQERSIARVTGTRGGVEGEELPDSPSPRPGSVAAMRSTAGDRSGVSRSASHSRSHSLLNQEEDRGEEEEIEEDREGSMDSIERVAEAALREFDTIVSSSTSRQRRGSKSPDSRPPSRFTAISPEPSLPPEHRSSDSPAQSIPNPSTSEAPNVDPHQINLQLLKELRDAQDYISYLQNELRGINNVVGQLRERGQEEEAEEELNRSNEHLLPQATTSRATAPSARAVTVPSEQLASLAIVKHLIALLPTSSLSSLSDNSLPLTSIASALEFTRRIDSLAHGGFRRREEDVFVETNLERLAERVTLRESE